jgi:hypothetical protein
LRYLTGEITVKAFYLRCKISHDLPIKGDYLAAMMAFEIEPEG